MWGEGETLGMVWVIGGGQEEEGGEWERKGAR